VHRRVADVEAVLEAEQEEAVTGAEDVEAAGAPLLLVGEPDDGTETAGAEVEGVDAAVHGARLRLRLGTGGAAAEEGDEGQRRLEAVVWSTANSGWETIRSQSLQTARQRWTDLEGR
jgi:hypothetical protein